MGDISYSNIKIRSEFLPAILNEEKKEGGWFDDYIKIEEDGTVFFEGYESTRGEMDELTAFLNKHCIPYDHYIDEYGEPPSQATNYVRFDKHGEKHEKLIWDMMEGLVDGSAIQKALNTGNLGAVQQELNKELEDSTPPCRIEDIPLTEHHQKLIREAQPVAKGKTIRKALRFLEEAEADK